MISLNKFYKSNPLIIKFNQVIILIFYIGVIWLVIHIFALAGLFIMGVYFVWQYFNRERKFCALCLLGKGKGSCILCKRLLSGTLGSRLPIDHKIFINSVLLLFITIVSLVFVYMESLLISRVTNYNIQPTISIESVPLKQYVVGEVFPMNIKFIGIKTEINAARMELRFDPELVEVTGISTKDSFANIFILKDIDNNIGYVKISGGLLGSKKADKEANFAVVYFKAKKEGIGRVEFMSSSMVLANDGLGTNVLKKYPSVEFAIMSDSKSSQAYLSRRPKVLGEKSVAPYIKFLDVLYFIDTYVLKTLDYYFFLLISKI